MKHTDIKTRVLLLLLVFVLGPVPAALGFMISAGRIVAAPQKRKEARVRVTLIAEPPPSPSR